LVIAGGLMGLVNQQGKLATKEKPKRSPYKSPKPG
jgi:hypothetical protein